MTQLSEKSLSFCTKVDPRLMAVVKEALSNTNQEVGVTAEQTRTSDEEAALVKAGRSHTMHSHHIIGYGEAQPGYSGAIDLTPIVDGRFQWYWPLIYPVALAMRDASIKLKTPITWGGCWDKLLWEIDGNLVALKAAVQANKFPDGPHYELGRN
jgi:hypothetical protein